MKSALTTIAFLFIFALLVSIGAYYYWGHDNQPESFTEGVALLKQDRNIQRTIGTYVSHSWKEKELPAETDNPASFKVAIQGTDAKVYLSCKIKKDQTGRWLLVETKQDSIQH